MDKRTIKKLNNYISAIADQNPDFVAAFLFGSYAKNKKGRYSDIDVALIIKNLDDDMKFDVQVQLMVLASQFDSRIEPHPVSENDFQSNNPFISEIKKTGIEIKPQNIIS